MMTFVQLKAKYEKAFAEFLGVPFALAFWQGRAAFYAVLKALRIQPGEEVLLPGLTCTAVPAAVLACGAKPIYADIHPDTFNLDIDCATNRLTKQTRVILAQHTFGLPLPMDQLVNWARAHRLFVVEDVAHALGSEYRGQALGTWGDAGFFSTQWTKTFSTGVGGIAVTRNLELAKSLLDLGQDFQKPPRLEIGLLAVQMAAYETLYRPSLFWLAARVHEVLKKAGLSVSAPPDDESTRFVPKRCTALQAFVGIQKMSHLRRNFQHRRKLAQFYEKDLTTLGIKTIKAPENSSPIFLNYPIRVAHKAQILNEAMRENIELSDWPISPLHPLKMSGQRFGYHPGSCPHAERAAKELIGLPTYPRVSVRTTQRILEFLDKMKQKGYV